MATNNPRKQKELGRKVRGFYQAKWETVCEQIVYRGNLAKFSQNPELREMLLSTGDKTIAEASPVNHVWGIGMAEDNPNVTDETLWGKNLLGIAIMQVREALRSS